MSKSTSGRASGIASVRRTLLVAALALSCGPTRNTPDEARAACNAPGVGKFEVDLSLPDYVCEGCDVTGTITATLVEGSGGTVTAHITKTERGDGRVTLSTQTVTLGCTGSATFTLTGMHYSSPAPTGTKDITVKVVIDGTPENPGDCEATRDLGVLKADLIFQALPEERESPPNEESPGGYMIVNDNDNAGGTSPGGNGTIDLDDSTPLSLADSDLKPITLNVTPVVPDATVSLTVPDFLRVWNNDTKDADATVGASVTEYPEQKKRKLSWPVAAYPRTLHLEGVKPGDGDLVLTYAGTGFSCEDKVKIHVVDVDLDVDSDNDNGLDGLEEDGDEERIEDVQNDVTKPGKVICVNDQDVDRDRIPDYVDGYDLLGDASAWDNDMKDFCGSAVEKKFAVMKLKLSDNIDLSTATITFAYSAADPKVAFSGTYPNIVYSLPNEHLRVWTKNAAVPRNKESVLVSDGNFVPADTAIPASKLGFDEHRVLTLYVEGIYESAGPGDLPITATVQGGLTPECSDKVVFTVVRMCLDVARWQRSGAVDQKDEYTQGSVVQLVPSHNPYGIKLSIPTLEIKPASVMAPSGMVQVWLKKFGPSASPGHIRVFRNGTSVFEDSAALAGQVENFTGTWTVDSIEGGAVDLALTLTDKTGGTPSGTAPGRELGHDLVRISSIPCTPKVGKVLFVNANACLKPASSPTPSLLYDDIDKVAAAKIADALAAADSEDNILVARGTYAEKGLVLEKGVLVGGLAGKWNDPNPAARQVETRTAGSLPEPLASYFDYNDLPAVTPPAGAEDSIFQATGSPGALVLTGLKLTKGVAGNAANKRGGAGRFVQMETELHVCHNWLLENTSKDKGGALYLDRVKSAKVDTCLFERNLASYETDQSAIDNGFGGGIYWKAASIDQELAVTNSCFKDDAAETVFKGTGLPALPGIASGGADIFITGGKSELTLSRFVRSRAGVKVTGLGTQRKDNGDPNKKGESKPLFNGTYYTGDGGAIRVHGDRIPDIPGAHLPQISVELCGFESCIAYGDGGAVYAATDGSAFSRGFGGPYPDPTNDRDTLDAAHDLLRGGAVLKIARSEFEKCQGGWHGGALAVVGRANDLTVEQSKFMSCTSGVVHLHDGKGGAIAICGGYQRVAEAGKGGKVAIKTTQIDHCISTGNGGGIYFTQGCTATLSDNTTVSWCQAEDRGNFVRATGMGGGVHVSAGAKVTMSGGCSFLHNAAQCNGGAIGIKSGGVTIIGAMTFDDNSALGRQAACGNGGAIYLCSNGYDMFLLSRMYYGEGRLDASDGGTTPGSRTLVFKNNKAARWGGAVYLGRIPEYPYETFRQGNSAGFNKSRMNAVFENNTASGTGESEATSDLHPDHIAVERCFERPPYGAVYNMAYSHIIGRAEGIGVYEYYVPDGLLQSAFRSENGASRSWPPPSVGGSLLPDNTKLNDP
jgi:hypothetical protein